MMSSVWMIRSGLVTGAQFSLGACLSWLLVEQDLSAGALLTSAGWGFIVWPLWVILWVAVCHGEELEDSRALASREGAGVDRLYTAAAHHGGRLSVLLRRPGTRMRYNVLDERSVRTEAEGLRPRVVPNGRMQEAFIAQGTRPISQTHKLETTCAQEAHPCKPPSSSPNRC
jgi:hypothetical protein